jgi:hypothetical protein
MKRIIILFLSAILTVSFGQERKDYLTRVGLMGNYDLSLNFPDKLTSSELARKLSVGIYVTDKQKKIILFGGVSFKLMRFTLLPTKFKNEFLKEYSDNYVPLPDFGIDSVKADGLFQHANGEDNNFNFNGSTLQGFHIGFILNNEYRPMIQYYRTSESLEFYNSKLGQFHPPNFDYYYTGIGFTAHEIKVGMSFLGDYLFLPYSINMNIGYKWINYNGIGFENSSFSEYTEGHDFSHFDKTGKITLSVSILLLSYKKGWNERK